MIEFILFGFRFGINRKNKGGVNNMDTRDRGEFLDEEIEKDHAWFANIKRTYDEYQALSLDHTRLLQKQQAELHAHTLKVLSDAQQDTNFQRAVANQALQNAVESANLVGKQNLRHSDIAIDRHWNLEPSEAASQDAVLNPVFIAAIEAAVAKAVQAATAKGKK